MHRHSGYPPGLPPSTRPLGPPPGLPHTSWRPNAADVGAAVTTGPQVLRRANDALQETCEGLSSNCLRLEQELKQSRLENKYLKERLYHPDDGKQLAVKMEASKAEAAELQRILTEEARKHKQQQENNMRMQWQLAMARDAEKAQRAALERLQKEFSSSRLALLVRVARAQSERNEMERDATRVRDWAVRALEEGGLDPRTVEGYEEAFTRRPGPEEEVSRKPPQNFEDMFDMAAFDVGGASAFVPREPPRDYDDMFDPDQAEYSAKEFMPQAPPATYEQMFTRVFASPVPLGRGGFGELGPLRVHGGDF